MLDEHHDRCIALAGSYVVLFTQFFFLIYVFRFYESKINNLKQKKNQNRKLNQNKVNSVQRVACTPLCCLHTTTHVHTLKFMLFLILIQSVYTQFILETCCWDYEDIYQNANAQRLKLISRCWLIYHSHWEITKAKALLKAQRYTHLYIHAQPRSSFISCSFSIGNSCGHFP